MTPDEEFEKRKIFYKGIRYLLKRQICFLKSCLALSKENHKLKAINKHLKKLLQKKNKKS